MDCSGVCEKTVKDKRIPLCRIARWRGFFFVEKTMARVMRICYNLSVTASDTGDREEVNCMEFFASLIIAVAAGVICHLICKWLDGDK